MPVTRSRTVQMRRSGSAASGAGVSATIERPRGLAVAASRVRADLRRLRAVGGGICGEGVSVGLGTVEEKNRPIWDLGEPDSPEGDSVAGPGGDGGDGLDFSQRSASVFGLGFGPEFSSPSAI